LREREREREVFPKEPPSALLWGVVILGTPSSSRFTYFKHLKIKRKDITPSP